MSTSKKLLQEHEILRPRDASLTSTDDWPEFSLRNATVTYPTESLDGVELASLLFASESNTLRIVGQLQPPENDAHAQLWWKLQMKPTQIEVTEVLSFSYGSYEDGTIELWAAGKAGWFVIRPSKQYKAMYDTMIEAVKILFFIVDAYSTPRKSGKGKNATILPEYNAQELFEKYAIEVMRVEKGAPEAAKKMYKHREFLLSSMIDGKEGMSWGKNPLYTHLNRKFAEDAKRIRQRKIEAKERETMKQQEISDKAKVEPRQHARQQSVDSTTTSSSLKRKRGRPPRDGASVDTSSIANSSNIEPQPRQLTTAKQATKPNNTSQTKSKGTRSTRSNPVQSNPEIFESHPATPAIQVDSDSEAHYNRRKSALRLKPNKSTKGPPRKSSKLAALATDAEENSEDEISLPHSAPKANGNGNKRKRDEPTTRAAKANTRSVVPAKHVNGASRTRSKAKQAEPTEDEGIDMPSSPSTSASDAIPGAEIDTDPTINPTDLALRLLHAPDQLQHNVWTCALDGCTHKVYGSLADPDPQRLIREHYALHAYDDDDRVRMVKGMAEPSLPVHRLVERMRGQVRAEGVGGSSLAGSGLDGVSSRFPRAVVTKY